MRTESDFIGEVRIPEDALYGIHSVRARENFGGGGTFPDPWYRAMGTVKQACYLTIRKMREAMEREYPLLLDHLRIPSPEILEALSNAAGEVGGGGLAGHFITPPVQGGAGTSINMNINEIITNRALILLGRKPGEYGVIDPIETANLFQSTNDVVPTALTVAAMQLLGGLEDAVNRTRKKTEGLETRYRNSLRLAHTQMEEAVPSTYGQLFSTYSEALSRDWWRVSKAFERIKLVNLGGGATGTGIAIPRYYLMEVVPVLKSLTGLPVTQSENLPDATCNLDRWVEVHAILKAHAVNLEKIASDLRLLASGTAGMGEVELPDRQVGSSIMPGKVNPVISEYLVTASRRIHSQDQQITSLAAQGCLDLNAYLPGIGVAMLESLELLIFMNDALAERMLEGIRVDEERAASRVFHSPSVTTSLSPLVGYHKAGLLARTMKEEHCSIMEANEKLALIDREQLERWLEPGQLLKKGFTMKDIQ